MAEKLKRINKRHCNAAIAFYALLLSKQEVIGTNIKIELRKLHCYLTLSFNFRNEIFFHR